ncbi:hypothetical protein [Deinococcus sp.]|uniref:hypothetical protein n=1 Tax=Deinococcus sp. TaxID=47478 RepID=UPI0039187A20
MGITPTKTRTKKPEVPAEPDFRTVDKLRRAWIAQLPTSLDTDAWIPDTLPENQIFLAHVAGYARQFMEWTHFRPDLWQAPSWYPERLALMTTWLATQTKTDLPQRREDALQILLTAWPKHLAHLRDAQLIYDSIPSLYTPEDLAEFGPLDVPLPYLPHWRVPDDASDDRREAARVGEEFTLYAGLTTWLNTQIGLPLLDLTPNPF